MVTDEQREKLESIIVNKWITSVFQPIASLKDGSVLGFEALSRVTERGVFDNVEEMFRCAEESGCIWMLEQVCRRAILKSVYEQKEALDQYNAKIFINVNPKVLHDEKFREGFTREYTRRYGIETERIVFEVTERERVEDEKSFKQAIEHYKMQHYQIAIDDVGSGYAGLNRICSLTPGYIKLDNELVRDAYQSPIKYAMIKGMVEFSHSSGTMLIAEGIETQKELELLIDLGVQYGQVLGILTREKLFQKLSGRYGYSLYYKKQIIELAEKNFLMVDAHTSISSVAKIAMEIDVDLAKCANPLTGLPGNIVIDQEVKESVESGKDCTIYYFDLDNFKAFNDVYGFEKGDEVIRILADVLKKYAGENDFVGHIGGDDFVMICEGFQTFTFQEKIRVEFEQRAHLLYKEKDRIQGYIQACNRHGVPECFPLVSVTIVSESNEKKPFSAYEEVVGILAGDKKAAKVKKRHLATG